MPTISEQTKKYGPVIFTENDRTYKITATVRHDDSCKNGYNTFSITGNLYRGESNGKFFLESGGTLHDDIAKHFPELAPYIKFHLCGTDGPLHYVQNTLYWLGYYGYCDGKTNSPPNLAFARSTAIWPELPEEYLCLPGATQEDKKAVVTQALLTRHPALMIDFRTAVEALGLTY